MKIHILYKFQNQPWGGGNQFLKALKKEFLKMGVYEESPEKTDVVLFNSHHNFSEVFKIKKKFPPKIFIHRIDGPLYLTRGRSKDLDRAIFKFDEMVADGIIFQSDWCRAENKKNFNALASYEATIYNAPDKNIFNESNKKSFNLNKIKLIATSWSPNFRKGFDVYKYLDDNLDFTKYSMIFIGNSPTAFKNIKQKDPVSSEELALALKEHDIYITASKNDPCSNSLIEALSCGLPAVVLSSGGHPELVKNGGELFNTKQDIILKIEKVAKNYYHYQAQIPDFLMEKIGQNYYEFAQRIYKDAEQKKYTPKKISFSERFDFCKIKISFLKMSILNKIFNLS